MASATDTASPDAPRPGARARGLTGRLNTLPLGSRLGRLIILLNILSLAILVGGELILNELRQGLVVATQNGLRLEGGVIADVIDARATLGEPKPALNAQDAYRAIDALNIPSRQRARIYDARGQEVGDSWAVQDRVDVKALPPVGWRSGWRVPALWPVSSGPEKAQAARAALALEVRRALGGETVMNTRTAEDGRRVISVSLPIRRVRAILGVLTLEAGDVDQVIAAERRALLPFILIAVGVSLLSSLLLTQLVAEPVLRLARAADRVRLQRSRAIDLPDLARRDDELGDLTRSLENMTKTSSDRLQAIESFAADVAHELRNPMTSIRSAVETLGLVEAPEAKARLLRVLNHDIGRMDRLITDISNASRLDAELSRNDPVELNLARLLGDICGFYQETRKQGQAGVRYIGPHGGEAVIVLGREGPLSQVVRNLIDNARSFSPPEGEVRVTLRLTREEAILTVDDDGPGIPPDNLETVFERFYTSRPKGAAFGGNSGLGLAIARQIVTAHGGRIWAENRREADRVAGARFSVALPRH
jgi:two-component system sensor histidine kinase ChvG